MNVLQNTLTTGMPVYNQIPNEPPEYINGYTSTASDARTHPHQQIPFWFKQNLTLEEAAAYFGIGVNKIRELTNDERCKCVLFVGTKRLIKRTKFEAFLAEAYSI